MADWQIGDLALCINDGPPRDVCGNGGIEAKREYIAALVAGEVYRIDSIAYCACGKHIGIGERRRLAGGCEDRFVKVTPGHDIEGFEEPRRIPVLEDA